jgi:uncharacterized membrane protein
MRLEILEVVGAMWQVATRLPLAIFVTLLVLVQGCASKESALEETTEANTEQAVSNEELAPIPPAPPVTETGLSNVSKKKSVKSKKVSPTKKKVK